MEKYKIVFRKSVSKDLLSIHKQDVQRILERIRSLADDPHPSQSQKLTGEEKYRLRCGVYRILYTIQDRQLVVEIVKVGHRKDVYRK